MNCEELLVIKKVDGVWFQELWPLLYNLANACKSCFSDLQPDTTTLTESRAEGSEFEHSSSDNN
jgi:hypothetical protein